MKKENRVKIPNWDRRKTHTQTDRRKSSRMKRETTVYMRSLSVSSGKKKANTENKEITQRRSVHDSILSQMRQELRKKAHKTKKDNRRNRDSSSKTGETQKVGIKGHDRQLTRCERTR